MANIPSIIQKMNDIEIAAEVPNSEATFAKMAGNINGLIDAKGALESGLSALQSKANAGVFAFTTNDGNPTTWPLIGSAGQGDIATLTVTLGANDGVMLVIGDQYAPGITDTSGLTLNFHNVSPSPQVGLLTYASIAVYGRFVWMRDSAEIKTIRTSTQGLVTLQSCSLVDRPGAGTFTYRLRVIYSSTIGGAPNTSVQVRARGSACLLHLKG